MKKFRELLRPSVKLNTTDLSTWDNSTDLVVSHQLNSILSRISIQFLESYGYCQEIDTRKCFLIFHVHLLPSTVIFFHRLLEIGFSNSNIMVIPKPYSTIPHAQQQVGALGFEIVSRSNPTFEVGWYDHHAEKLLEKGVSRARKKCETGIDRCILIDDGGLLTDAWWRRGITRPEIDAVSIQQTASGLYFNRLDSKIRRINVASSAAKRFFESKVIVAGVLRKVGKLQVLKDHNDVGIIGLGSIGAKLANELYSHGYNVFTYDIVAGKNIPGPQAQSSWQECVSKADIVFGCTGRNFMQEFPEFVQKQERQKRLISLSSRDIEFRSILREGDFKENLNPFDDLSIKADKDSFHVLYNGGFPINFDRLIEWENESEINLTRSLVLLGILQALCVRRDHNPNRIDKLAIKAQREIVGFWLAMNNQRPENYGVSFKNFNSAWWWKKASEAPALSP